MRVDRLIVGTLQCATAVARLMMLVWRSFERGWQGSHTGLLLAEALNTLHRHDDLIDNVRRQRCCFKFCLDEKSKASVCGKLA